MMVVTAGMEVGKEATVLESAMASTNLIFYKQERPLNAAFLVYKLVYHASAFTFTAVNTTKINNILKINMLPIVNTDKTVSLRLEIISS
jgi:hypothetical protein